MRAVHMPSGAVVHVTRPDDDHKAMCGAATYPNRAGAPIEVDISTTTALGRTQAGLQLTWCGKCLGVLAVADGLGEFLADAVLVSRPR